MGKHYRDTIERLLGLADIRVGGGRPWDLQVQREEFFRRVLAHGTLGLGETWMEGWWDCPALDQLVARAWSARLPEKVQVWRDLPRILQARLSNLQRGRRAFKIGTHHYDIGDELYRRMLGPTMMYSCGYWREAETLDAAQMAKVDLVCRKLQLEPGQRVLDIGCGWGTAARSKTRTDPWIARYIFPNSNLPSAQQITRAAEGRMILEDWHNFGADYDRTLMCWYANIEGSWTELDSARYDERFQRMWRYYLLSCAGSFRARELQLWQLVFARSGVRGGYHAHNIR